MDYNSMKKLASVMGEEFKMIDSITLENINLQRLITKEKEYCTHLENLLKQIDEDKESADNETRRIKNKLEEVSNRGILLKTSLESLKSSHKMVDLLKVDLEKQLHLEEIKSSEKNMKFDSTIKKHEIMWENYQSTYQKFPLVSVLHKCELKVKQKSIQLAIQERSLKAFQEKIEVLSKIFDKREKVTVVNIAEKYLERRKHILDKNILENNIRLKEESLKIVKDGETRGKPLAILNSGSKKDFYRKPRSYITSDLDESNKENVYISNDLSTISPSKTYFERYEAILAKRFQSVPLLKLPPLPLLDSPPRKVRSVGNLLSPPKTDWSKDDIDRHAISNAYGADLKQQNSCGSNYISYEQNSSKTTVEADQNNSVSKAQNQNPNISLNQDTLDNEMEFDNSEGEKKFEIKETEGEVKSAGKVVEAMEVDEESGITGKKSKVEPSNEFKSIIPLNSVEFSCEQRTEKKCSKIPDAATEQMKSPYFVPDTLNFLEIPKNVEEFSVKEKSPQKDNAISDLDKNVTVIRNMNEEMENQRDNKNKNLEDKRQELYLKSENVSDISCNESKKQETIDPLGMDLDSGNAAHDNTYIISDAEGKLYGGTKDEGVLSHNSSVHQPNSKLNQLLQFDASQENPNLSFETQMEYSQASYVDSVEEAETSYASMSPDPSMVQSSFPLSPNINVQDHVNIFGSPPGYPSFNYKYSGHQQSSASALFADASPTNIQDKEKKQTEVFNVSFDSKRNTSSTVHFFKLF